MLSLQLVDLPRPHRRNRSVPTVLLRCVGCPAPRPACGVRKGNPRRRDRKPDLYTSSLLVAQTTPLWRRSHDSTHILCNACALFFKMKGRARPISLKTDVIKSRNRSKGKSSSKDRGPKAAAVAAATSSPRGTSKERSESMTRSGDGRKSVPGGSGAGEDDSTTTEGRSKPFADGAMAESDGRKARKVMPTPGGMSPYGMPFPPYPYPYGYPHAPHPHAHSPYPPPSARSRSSDPARRAQSLDARQRPVGSNPTSADGSPAPPSSTGGPNPVAPMPPYPYPGFHPGAPPTHEGYPGYPPFYPYGPAPAGFTPGQPPPHYPYPAPPFPHAAALAHAAQAALAQRAGSADSRARSPATVVDSNPVSRANSRPGSRRGSASPPQPAPPTIPQMPFLPNGLPQSWYPHPNPNYHLHQPHTHSPLAVGARSTAPSSRAPSGPGSPAQGAKLVPGMPHMLPPFALAGSSGQNSKASSAANSSDEASRSGAAVPTPPITSAAASPFLNGQPTAEASTSSAPGGRSANNNPAGLLPSQARERGASVVSSPSPSASGSSEGIRSPEPVARGSGAASWSLATGSAPTATPDERRGRPEKRFDDFGGIGKGKGRIEATMDDLNEIDELDEDGASVASNGTSRQRMVGVETGLHELRVSGSLIGPGAPSSVASASPVTTRATESPSGSSLRRGGAGGSSRSRSRARGEPERGRSRGPLGGPSIRSTSSTSRVRGGPGSTTSSSGASGRDKADAAAKAELQQRDWPADAVAEVQRLRNKISELTFLNGLMQSRLGQLEGPGRVPRHVMTSLTAETPRPDPDEMLYDQEEDEQMQQQRPDATDQEAAARAF